MSDDVHRQSRWILRALEWDEPRARYPNVWAQGMPVAVLAAGPMASRLRLWDLVAVYSPASTRHTERSDRFVGLSRVTALRVAHAPDLAWIELETAHRFSPPLDLADAPRRVLLCCDPGWPETDVVLFRRVFDAAVQGGWTPRPSEREEEATAARTAARTRGDRAQAPGPPPDTAEAEAFVPSAAEPVAQLAHAATSPVASAVHGSATAEAVLAPPEEPQVRAEPRRRHKGPTPHGRRFGGVDYSGEMRDPRDGTWLAVLELREDRLEVVRLEPTGRSGLEGILRNADSALPGVEAIGLDFPFGLPLPFAESLLGGPFGEQGWWMLARRLERMSRPEFLMALHGFRDAHGEIKRVTDEAAGAFSPLHRINPDLGPMTYHGIRMIAEERSRFAIRPFESAQGRLLLEVYPGGFLRKSGVINGSPKGGRASTALAALPRLDRLPVDIGEPHLDRCQRVRDALDAVLAARCAAAAVLGGEADDAAADLAPDDAPRVRKEGWIYGLRDVPRVLPRG